MTYSNETVLPQHNAPNVAPVPPLRPADAAFRDAIMEPSPPPQGKFSLIMLLAHYAHRSLMGSSKWACKAALQHPGLGANTHGDLVPSTISPPGGSPVHPFEFVENTPVGQLGCLDTYLVCSYLVLAIYMSDHRSLS